MNKMLKNIITGLLLVSLCVSVAFNIHLSSQETGREDMWNINFPVSNSRDTYYTIHNIKEAQTYGKGEGVKVGILDWCFGFEEHEGLYAAGRDFTSDDMSFKHASEHGFWMAQTLKEIAPDTEIYALGTYVPDNEDEWVDAMTEAIDWSIENKLDILTLSHEAISDTNRARFDKAVNRAVEQGLVTTFIHYDNPNNILPWGIWENDGEYDRLPDVNIFQYDYNTLFTENYSAGMNDKNFGTDYKQYLFLSLSSMSVVTAGFVAILKSVDNTLTPVQYKEILINTSHHAEYEKDRADHVVDIGKAVRWLKDEY